MIGLIGTTVASQPAGTGRDFWQVGQLSEVPTIKYPHQLVRRAMGELTRYIKFARQQAEIQVTASRLNYLGVDPCQHSTSGSKEE